MDAQETVDALDHLTPPPGYRFHVWNPDSAPITVPNGILNPIILVIERIADGKLWQFEQVPVKVKRAA